MSLKYENIIQETLRLFPEYVKTTHYEDNDQELAYSFFSGFCNYVLELAKKDDEPASNEKIKLAFKLFNEMIESDDSSLSNLAVVEVIESLVQEKVTKKLCERLLSSEGQKWLKEVLKYTGVKD
jgi:hypothetical protein